MKVTSLGIDDWAQLPLKLFIDSPCFALPEWLPKFVTWSSALKEAETWGCGIEMWGWGTVAVPMGKKRPLLLCTMYLLEKALIALHYVSFMVVPNHSQESKWTRNSFAYRLRCSHYVLDLTQTEPGSNVCVLWQGRFSKPLSLQNLSTVI